MISTDKNIFSTLAARQRLLVLGWTVTELARRVNHPRETVSKAIHTNKFPLVRRKVAKKLKLELV